MNVLKIARLAFVEARWRKLFWAVALLGLAYLIIYAAGVFFMYREVTREVTRFAGPMANTVRQVLEPLNFFVLAGFYGMNFLVVVLGLLISVDTIAGEISSGTIQTLVTKPLRRWEIVAGKWLGLAAMLAVFTVIMSAALVGIVWVVSRYVPPNIVRGVGLIILEGLVVLSLSILGGTRLPALANGVVIFMLYGLAFIAGWIEQIGSVLRNEAAVNMGIIVSLIMPSEAMWKRAAYLMQPPFLRELGFETSPFGASSSPSPLMVVYTVIYVAVALLIAVRWFSRRDL